MMKAISTVFTTEDQQEMKQAFKEIIIDQFRGDVEANEMYLFDSNDITSMVDDAFNEAIEEMKLEFKEKLRKQMLDMIESMDIEKVLSLKKKIK